MLNIKSFVAGVSAAIRNLFAPTTELLGDFHLRPQTETERYISLYRMNRSAPYFNEADEESADGLLL